MTDRRFLKSSVLEKILHEAWDHSQNGRPLLVVFDLDSTLFDLTGRVTKIIDRFRQIEAVRFPEECRRLNDIQILQTDWGLKTPLERLGLPCEGPFFAALHQHWADAFFSNEYLIYDKPLPGAVTFVQKLHEFGAHIMYLTGRDIPRMGDGTYKSLLNNQFPIDSPTVQLVLKPHPKMDDAAFKAEVLRDFERKYKRIWFFENEPVNLNLVARECPNIKLVFVETAHSGREEPSPFWERITHFEIDIETLPLKQATGDN